MKIIIEYINKKCEVINTPLDIYEMQSLIKNRKQGFIKIPLYDHRHVLVNVRNILNISNQERK